ncbi:S8 family serine peptidase [Nocardioides mesophilus]|uniref:S8 family peptidase n=1 Tax=Nocardioides mesophilus TaxID=433659 RepID=A0A7G9RBA3_9ACTN|nr:S8 family serine peptidase [Nocardioides mesophilus]QNN52878.1 S8 family peptidase [Nocardioides mesophilus]
MSIPSHGRRARRRALALISAGAVVAGALGAVPAATAAGDSTAPQTTQVKPGRSYQAGRYIVVLQDAPAAAYAGGVAGYKATTPAPGKQLDSNAPAVREYTGRLRAQQVKAARTVGAKVDRSYTLAVNGFTADLTGDQAAELAMNKSVLTIERDVASHLDTWNTPNFLGLSGKDGAWKEQAHGRGNAGQGTVVGVIDSGIWPEAKSFRGAALTSEPKGKWGISRVRESVRMDKADGGVFTGACELEHDGIVADGWSADDCNTKLIGARFYPDAYIDNMAGQDMPGTEFLSARDGDGHGSHTASTAAGNPVKDATVEDVNFGEISGMAPGARIAAYKVCFDDGNEDTGDCFNSAILAAIDDAVNDGVDVINFSISGALDSVLDSTELAFEGAAEAGVFVAASAGNSGPKASTVAHNSPWLTTVAASTHTNFENTVVLGNGTKIKGASITKTALPQTPLVESSAVAAAGAEPGDAALCLPETLDPAKVKGKIVLCTRGVNPRVEKSAVVKEAGGVGMILANIKANSLDTDFHAVPTVHINDLDGVVFDYIKSQGAAATAAFELGDTTGGPVTPLPQIAGFSSRGPALANDSNLLKPDITAPGVSVLAAVAPPSGEGRNFDLYSGTSMSSPHIAGLAAFMMGVHPEWTPMQVKSAMMTTAKSLKNAKGGTDRDVFGQGAGQVTPQKMFDPGLFVTSNSTQWWRFIEDRARKELGFSLGLTPLDAKDLNVPSMADSKVVGSTTFTRKFKATESGTWKVSVKVPGFSATAPATLQVRKGLSKNLTIKLTRTTGSFDQWSMGYLTLNGPSRVRLPIAVKPVAVAAPAEVSGEGTSGSVDVPVTVGGAPVKTSTSGLALAQSKTGTATDIKSDASDIVTTCITVPADTEVARFALDAVDDNADMDLWIYEGCTTPGDWYNDYYTASATGSADESVTLDAPAAGDYLVAVDPYSAGDTPSLDWRLDSYTVGATDTLGALTVDPSTLTPTTTSYKLSWSGLVEDDARYLGIVKYENSEDRTFLTVTTPAASPAP